MTKKVSYAELEQIMHELGAQVCAAEAHGLLVGMSCLARQPIKEEDWRVALTETLDCKPPTQKQWDKFKKVTEQISDEFNHLNFAFSILLPDDEEDLADRVAALGYWCRGYLSGLGLVGITSDDLKNDIVKELIHDISQIAHINMDTDASEDDEFNYMEIVEYVRIAVQNIRVELQGTEEQKMIH